MGKGLLAVVPRSGRLLKACSATAVALIVPLLVVSPVAGEVGRKTSTPPIISAFTASTSRLPAGGGIVRLSAVVANAASCTFTSKPKVAGLPATLSCNSGTASKDVSLPANTTASSQTYSFALTATSASGGSAKASPVSVTVAPPPKPSAILFGASPSVLPSAGGQLTLYASVLNASSCKFTSKPAVAGLPATVDCGTGTATKVVNLPANAGTTAKSYSFQLSVTGPAGTAQVGPTIATVNPAGVAPPPVKHVSGTLTEDTTWSPQDASVYIIDSTITIPQGITLTVNAGTVVKGQAGGLEVAGGSLVAQGTAAAPVVFTSIYDASAGGATATSQSPSPGAWAGITVYDSGSAGGSDEVGGHVNLARTRLSYATVQTPTPTPGFGGHTPPVQDSTVTLDYLSVDHAPNSLDLRAAPYACGFSCAFSWLNSVGVTNSTFTDNNDRAEIDGQTVTVSNNVFAQTGAIQALIVDSSGGMSPPRVEGNTVTSSGASPTGCTGDCGATINVRASQLDLGLLTGNSGSGNTRATFGLEGTITTSGSLASVIPSGWTTTLESEPYYECCPAGGLTVGSGATLTIPAGMVIKSYSPGITVAGGTLTAQGTAAAPVVFTSIYDASPGGATDTSGPPAPGAWAGITVYDSGNAGGSDEVGGHVNLTRTRLSYATVQTPTPTPYFGGHTPPVQDSTVSLDYLSVDHAPYSLDLRAAPYACGFSCVFQWFQSVSVTNSTFSNNNDRAEIDGQSVTATSNVFAQTGAIQALSIDSQGTAPQVAKNTVTGSGASSICSLACGATISVHAVQLDLGQLTGNGGSGNTAASFGLAGTLTTSGSLASVIPNGWTTTLESQRYGFCCGPGGLTVSTGATLTIPADAILKATSGNGLTVAGGSLVAQGTAAAPVVVTSIYDASPGGATDTSQSPSPGAWAGLILRSTGSDVRNPGVGGHLNLTYTRISYATVQSAPRSGDFGTAALAGSTASLDHITVQHAPYNLDLRPASLCLPFSNCSVQPMDSATVTNSTFTDNDDRAKIDANTVIVTGNSFIRTAGPRALMVNSEDATPPQVKNNTVTDSGSAPTCGGDCGATITVTANQLDLTQLTGNTGSGNARQSFGLGGTLSISASLASAVPAGWTTILENDPNNQASSGITVPTGVTLTIPAGMLIKSYSPGLTAAGGTLIAQGTAAAPVVFTSIYDGSAGGAIDTSQSPSPGAWAGIRVGASGTATLLATTIRFAATALDVADSATALIHGAVTNSTLGIRANSWVDATGVDWGDPSGPAPIGTGTPIQGDGVFVTPWLGYVEPARPPQSQDPPVAFADCRQFLVIGVRGSGEAPQGDPPTYTDAADGFGSRAWDAYYGFRQYLSSYGYSDSSFKLLGLRYRALGVVFNPLNFGTTAYYDSIYEGVDNLISQLDDERSNCPTERAVLIGYSQGALVIHLALRLLDDVDPSMLTTSRIAGVMLIADPAKIPHGSETTWEAENEEALPGSGVDKASGIWTLSNQHDLGALPTSVTDRTIAICHNHDIICAPGIGASTSNHTNYDASELNALGAWEARRVLGLTVVRG
jgi:Cutinase